MELMELLARPLLAILRFVWWLSWDFVVLTISWSIGWPIWRLLTLGRFPHAGFREYEESGTGEAFLVCGTGFALLGAAIWLLSSRVMQ
jgi:hypothetical protein